MKLLYTLVFVAFASLLQGQILEPVKWEMTSKTLSADEVELTFTAKMDDKWAIYSQFTDDNGPVPTSFYFTEGSHYTRMGKVVEKGKKKEGPDPLFGDVNVIKFTQSPVIFVQKVKVTDFSKPITGYLEFMTCDDERCLPPTEVDFSFALKPAAAQGVAPAKTPDSGSKTDASPAPKGQETPQKNDDKAPTPTASTETIPTETAASNAVAISVAEKKSSDASILQPIRWVLDVTPLEGGEAELKFTAIIDKGWTLYSQDTEENGPIPTAFYRKVNGQETVMKMTETGDQKEGMDPTFGVMVKKFEHGPVVYVARVKTDAPISGTIDYMSCDDVRCIPLNTEFTVNFAPLAATIGEESGTTTAVANPSSEGSDVFGGLNKAVLEEAPVGECSEEVAEAKKGIWQIFGLGFLGGLIALLTPCVFPMVPLTVSFFTKSATSRKKGLSNALLYGFFIFLVYILLSIPFHLMDSLDPDILNKISTDVTLNVVFFVVFIIFAISFFGYFELTLPESWTNKASSAEGAGGIIGIFFMALTLALVSFSCTGPILGSLLVGALTGDGGAMQLTAGMGGFGLALALPFAVFAAFPGMMKSLPKSGGWLNSVKVVLGFAELALAFKFLSNADLVDHWGLLKIETFLAIWIAIGIGLALYLLGIIKFPHDSPIKKLSVARMGLAVLTIAFVAYLASGFRVDEAKGTYQPLTLLSGLAPPVCYSILRPCDCPQQLDCFKDLEAGLAYAKQVNKPVMLDFTGYACVNCRKMEENVWPESAVYPYLKDDYVVISLYVDDKKKLDAPINVITHTGRERELDEVGEKWQHLQAALFNQNSQPQYILISPDGRRLNTSVNYTPDVNEYAEFLRCGLENFKKLQ